MKAGSTTLPSQEMIKRPEIRFDGISQTAGIELIEAARGIKTMNKTERKGDDI
jgi:hypothetical protein